DWVGTSGVHLQPLADALRQAILAHRIVQADETPVQMLKPGTKKTHRAYLWAYAPGAFEDLKAVVYDFTEGRAGEHARLPGRLARHPHLRRLLGVQGLFYARHVRDLLHGACAPQILRIARRQ